MLLCSVCPQNDVPLMCAPSTCAGMYSREVQDSRTGRSAWHEHVGAYCIRREIRHVVFAFCSRGRASCPVLRDATGALKQAFHGNYVGRSFCKRDPCSLTPHFRLFASSESRDFTAATFDRNFLEWCDYCQLPVGVRKPQEAQKAKALWALKASKDSNEEFYDPALEEDIS